MQNQYFKKHWNENREGDFSLWGTSIWYFEVGIDNYPQKQIELYENGKILKYSLEEPEDEYGGLGDQELELEEFKNCECTKEEFYTLWNQ